MDILDKIISNKKKEVSLLKKSFPIEDLESGIKNKSYLKRDFLGSFLDRNIISIIAEIKKASPSKGVILEDFQPLKIALEYEAGGASAISILTDELFFKGKIDYIPSVRTLTTIPLLRKDFIVDEYQNLTAHEADSIITRLGKGSKIIFCGDTCQTDFTRNNEKDIDKFLAVVNRMPQWFDINEFESGDIVRSGIVKEYIRTKEKMG